jgi:lipoprotein-releasing system permease protein
MSYEFFVSLRYLRAKRKQVFVSVITFISVAGIFLGVAALIIVLAVMNGFETDLRNKILGINSHIVLMEYNGSMKQYSQVIKDIENVPGVVAATPFIYSQAMVKRGNSASGVVLRGLQVESAFQVITLGKMKEGKMDFLHADRRPAERIGSDLVDLPGIIVGKELAKNLGIFLYEPISIVSPTGMVTPMGMVPRMKRFLVVGIFDSGFYEYDSTLAFVSLKDCQEFLNMGDLVTGVEIRVNDIYRADAIAKTIERK